MINSPMHSPLVFYTNAIETAEDHCACAEASTDSRLPNDLFDAKTSRLHVNYFAVDDVAEEHCACAEANTDLGPSRISLKLSVWRSESAVSDLTWQRTSGSCLSALPDAHAAVFSPRSPGHVIVLNSSAWRLLEGFTYPHSLEQAPILAPDSAPPEALRAAYQLAALGLLQPLDTAATPVPVKSRTLSAWLHLTDACNLRCSYCYVTKSADRMDDMTGRAAIDAVFRSALRNGYRAVKLKYAGGEPTLHFDLVRSLHAHATALANESGLALQEVILSNGVALTSDMLDFLRAAGIRQMISLDGLGTDHDGQRPFENGAPSSGHVLQAIDRAIARGLRPHISISVRPENVASLAETVRFVLDRDLLFNLNFVREALPASAGWEAEFIAGIQAALAVIEARLPQRRLIDGLLDRCTFAGAHDYPCGAGRDYIAVAPRGTVARCHMTLTQPVGDVWAADPLEAIRATTSNSEFQVSSVDTKADCRNCTWRSICAGGCPLQTARTRGRGDVASPYCKIYQAILPELVRLEGLRILKWQVAA